jgi:chorismate mutase
MTEAERAAIYNAEAKMWAIHLELHEIDRQLTELAKRRKALFDSFAEENAKHGGNFDNSYQNPPVTLGDLEPWPMKPPITCESIAT